MDGDDGSNTSSSQRIESLKKQLQELNKQIKEIKDMALPEDRKNETVKKFEQQIQSVQTQINDALEGMAKK